MTGFDFRPSRPIAISMIIVAALLFAFGLITFIRDGFSPFAVLWLAVAAFIVLGFVRRFARPAPDDGGMRPSRPMAVVSAVFAVGMAVFGVLKFGAGNPAFLAFWLAALAAIAGAQLWAAFRPPAAARPPAE
jgi:hypothetical protein